MTEIEKWLKNMIHSLFKTLHIQIYKNQRMKEDILWQVLIKNNKNVEVNSLISDNFREKKIIRDKSILQQKQASVHGKA